MTLDEVQLALKKLASRKRALEAKEAKLREIRQGLTEEERKIWSGLDLICTSNLFGKGCGKIFHPCDTEYIQTYWYDNEPYSESWLLGEGQFDCPHCGHRNREYDHAQVEKRPEIFKAVLKTHSQDFPPKVNRI